MSGAAGILLEARGLEKSYGGVRALRGVDFAVRAGEVHALLGENGAGKSTLVKILSGSETRDAGETLRDGAAVALASPAEAGAAGVQVIHQELELAPALSAAENVFMGRLPRRGFGLVDKRALLARAAAVLEGLGARFDPRTPVERLRIADRQVVEIAKALVRDARVLFLDEPTAALPPVEARRVLERMGALAAAGVGVVFVSHRLDEVLAVADKITVMRDGRVVAAALPRSGLDRGALVRHIVGRDVLAPPRDGGAGAAAPGPGAPAILVRGLRAPPLLAETDIELRGGEVLGAFGLLGAGHGAIAEALFGVRPGAAAARARVLSLDRLPRDPAEAIGHGLGYVPADRKSEGLALSRPVEDNLLLADFRPVARAFGVVDAARARERAGGIARGLDLRFDRLGQAVGELSGGNQQKVSLGKWRNTACRVLLLDEPTRGVDVGAKAEIHRLLRRFAAGGNACLVVSSDAEEIAAACDRALVVRRGRVAAELAGAAITEAALTAAAL